MILGFLFFIQTLLKLCKALSTEKYKRYINILLLLLYIIIIIINLATGFPASSNRCRCTTAYSAISPTVLASKQIRKS